MPLTLPTKNGKPFYCGPWAIAAVTGESQDRIEGMVQCHRGTRKPVRGMWRSEVIWVLRSLGVGTRSFEYPVCSRPTLARWLDESRESSRQYIVNVTGHWLSVHGRRICDHHGLLPIEQYPNRRKRVCCVIEVRPLASARGRE